MSTHFPVTLTLFLAISLWPSVVNGQEPPAENAKQSKESPVYLIPDGTPVRLRYAEGVHSELYKDDWLVLKRPVPQTKKAREDDTVRLVVSDDVRIDGKVVIARGAPAQATITMVQPRQPKYQNTGLLLRLDWVVDVTGEHLPLRTSAKGKQDSFSPEVISQQGGHEVRPGTFKDALTAGATLGLSLLRHKAWIPTGSRMTGYVHGDIAVDRERMDRAQVRFPARNTRGLVTVYRLKGDAGKAATVSCADQQVLLPDQLLHIAIELAPGTYSCRVGTAKPIEINVAAGEEYYLFLRGGKLRQVSKDEGEDGVARTAAAPN